MFKNLKKALYNKYKKFFFKEFFKELDYKLIYESYKKYTQNLLVQTPDYIEFEKFDNPLVSIIIPVFNQYDLTMKCLQSIKNNTPDLSYEIIIIDDCSTDETKNIENKVKNITVIKNENNLGFLKNCNKGASIAKGKYIYLLNNDTQLMPNAINELYNLFEQKKDAGAIGSKLVYPDGKLQGAGSIIQRRGHTLSLGHNENPLEEQYNTVREVHYSCGASLMIKADLWKELNGFDEIYSPAYYEETDLCLSIIEKGYKVYYQPASEIIHYSGQTYSNKSFSLMRTNRKKFFKKWKNKFKLLNIHV